MKKIIKSRDQWTRKQTIEKINEIWSNFLKTSIKLSLLTKMIKKKEYPKDKHQKLKRQQNWDPKFIKYLI